MYFITEGAVSVHELQGGGGLALAQYKNQPVDSIELKAEKRPLSWFGEFHVLFDQKHDLSLKADDELTSLMQFFKKGYMAGKLLNVL